MEKLSRKKKKIIVKKKGKLKIKLKKAISCEEVIQKYETNKSASQNIQNPEYQHYD